MIVVRVGYLFFVEIFVVENKIFWLRIQKKTAFRKNEQKKKSNVWIDCFLVKKKK